MTNPTNPTDEELLGKEFNDHLNKIISNGSPLTKLQLVERMMAFRSFIDRGLVVMDEEDNPDGSCGFTYTQPDHPEIVAFNACEDIDINQTWLASIMENRA